MSEPIDLSIYREARKAGGWQSGLARCLDCKHEWASVAPAGTQWLQCPACSLVRGRMVMFHEWEGVKHWTCVCGNDLFNVTEDRIYCPNCGITQEGAR